MNKYQEYIFKNLFNFILWNEETSKLSKVVINDFFLILEQLEDITITNYSLLIEVKDRDCLDSLKIEYFDDNKWHSIKLYKENLLKINIDFDKPIRKLQISSIKNLFDKFVVNINYVFADKEEYYAKKKLEDEAKKIAQQKEINQLIHPQHKTGIDLVNIYWSLVSDKIAEVTINLYSISDGKERLIGRYNEATGLFKSITGLAFGEYCYEIIEHDASKNEIARSDKIKFILLRPNYSGRPVVSNR